MLSDVKVTDAIVLVTALNLDFHLKIFFHVLMQPFSLTVRS